jgi:GNAT superfamily N-acetyltransferase
MEVRTYNPSTDTPLLKSITDIHISCILTDATIATFTPPLHHTKIQNWWQERSAAVSRGTSTIFLAFAPWAEELHVAGAEKHLAGFVYLDVAGWESGPYRGEVQKLLVSPKYRNRGVARALMGALEGYAKAREVWLMMLSTESGSPAESVYLKFGYTSVSFSFF